MEIDVSRHLVGRPSYRGAVFRGGGEAQLDRLLARRGRQLRVRCPSHNKLRARGALASLGAEQL